MMPPQQQTAKCAAQPRTELTALIVQPLWRQIFQQPVSVLGQLFLSLQLLLQVSGRA